MDEEDYPEFVIDAHTFMLCTMGTQEGDTFMTQIPVLSRDELLEANSKSIACGWEAHADEDYLNDILVEGNRHPIVTALLHVPSQLVTCRVLVSETDSIWLTMQQEEFEQLDLFEIPSTVH